MTKFATALKVTIEGLERSAGVKADTIVVGNTDRGAEILAACAEFDFVPTVIIDESFESNKYFVTSYETLANAIPDLGLASRN